MPGEGGQAGDAPDNGPYGVWGELLSAGGGGAGGDAPEYEVGRTRVCQTCTHTRTRAQVLGDRGETRKMGIPGTPAMMFVGTLKLAEGFVQNPLHCAHFPIPATFLRIPLLGDLLCCPCIILGCCGYPRSHGGTTFDKLAQLKGKW